MTQPRRIAATSLAKRISEERGDQHGSSVGHQIRLDSCVGPTTNLVVTTRFAIILCFVSIISLSNHNFLIQWFFPGPLNQSQCREIPKYHTPDYR